MYYAHIKTPTGSSSIQFDHYHQAESFLLSYADEHRLEVGDERQSASDADSSVVIAPGYEVHVLHAGRLPRVIRHIATEAEALEIAEDEASEYDDGVWCEASSWHDEPGLQPVGGYDLGDQCGVVIYQAVE